MSDVMWDVVGMLGFALLIGSGILVLRFVARIVSG